MTETPYRTARSGPIRASRLGLRRLSGGATSCTANGAKAARGDIFHRRLCKHQGFALSASFAMGKFALRGLAQSAARELGPKGIHVAHFVIDGGVRSADRRDPAEKPDCTLSPEGIAQTYLDVLRQPRDSWSLEVELRPWVETF